MIFFRIFFALWGRLVGALSWITASSKHLLTAALIISLIGNAWLCNARQSDRTAEARILGKWQWAFERQKHATGLLSNAIHSQNSAIEAWRLQGIAHREAAARALREAERVDGQAKARADRLDALAATSPPSGPDCRTPLELMAQKDEL